MGFNSAFKGLIVKLYNICILLVLSYVTINERLYLRRKIKDYRIYFNSFCA